MKICYLFREKERHGHSIEILFDAIIEEMEVQNIVIEKWYRPLSLLKAIKQLKSLNADIYHITGDCYFLSLFLPWKKTIMTIHDIGMYKNHPKTLKKYIFVILSFIIPLKLLKYSTAVSQLAKDDLIQILHINPKKLIVIPNPLVFPIKYSPKEFNSKCPTILQIGTGEHKNLIGLIEAIKGISCKLEIVGDPTIELIEKMNYYNINYNISTNISNKEVIKKYVQCDILYFASLSEGFGLPILEAQAMGRCVITSNTEPTKSVCSKGGILVNPQSFEEIKAAIQTIIASNDVRERIIHNGLVNVNKYNIKMVVEQYISLYNKILENNNQKQ